VRQRGIIRLAFVLSVVAGLIALVGAITASSHIIAPAYFIHGEEVGPQVYYAWAFSSVFVAAFVCFWLLLSLIGWAIRGLKG
jgi:hypothetical protein